MKQQEDRAFKVHKTTYYPMWVWEKNGPIPNLDIEHWVNTCYLIKSTEKSVVKSNAFGYQSRNDLHNDPLFFPLVEILRKEITLFYNYSNFKIMGLWLNISGEGCYNNLHYHGLSTKLISGVLYLKTPPNCGAIQFWNKYNDEGSYRFEPTVGSLLLFPQCLQHNVEPNLSKEDRISIAFNCE